jgi:hypothetical protein
MSQRRNLRRRRSSLATSKVLVEPRGTLSGLHRQRAGPDHFENDGRTACWKTPRPRPTLVEWPKVIRSRSRLSPIFCAMAVSDGRSAKTNSLSIDPRFLSRQDARPLPTPPRRWRSRSPTGGRGDDPPMCFAPLPSKPIRLIESRREPEAAAIASHGAHKTPGWANERSPGVSDARRRASFHFWLPGMKAFGCRARPARD